MNDEFQMAVDYTNDAAEATRVTYIAPKPGTCNPVSYTHLRAHETVLDLVCRLLLDKKKYVIDQSRTLLHVQC